MKILVDKDNKLHFKFTEEEKEELEHSINEKDRHLLIKAMYCTALATNEIYYEDVEILERLQIGL